MSNVKAKTITQYNALIFHIHMHHFSWTYVPYIIIYLIFFSNLAHFLLK